MRVFAATNLVIVIISLVKIVCRGLKSLVYWLAVYQQLYKLGVEVKG